ncbi:MAG: thermostable hemolysin delta-VPH [Clostridia bacterium]|nr:thermostable hemolysin delta-VPH [Clostridia bacterium]
MYFNYHAKAKNLIKNGKLVDCQIVDKYNNISPALLLIFEDGYIMPIRQHKWQEYFDIINKKEQ